MEDSLETRPDGLGTSRAPESGRIDELRIGRFLILRKLGEGGMGCVFLAYDEELDRKLAVKLWARESRDERGRMQREAQALARLSHPNVVQVYEVGEHFGQLYLALEYIEGSTMRTWVQGRGVSELVQAYVQAGRGLAAAHRAGVVHRDVKPDNVMVGVDGRVRVLDFGLARAALDEVTLPSAEERLTSSRGAMTIGMLDTPMTRVGALLGTPAYMPPEQLRRGVADARSDQFSLCASLWEALFGVRPYLGDTVEELAEAIARGQPAEPPGRRAPRWVRVALLRGLSADPAARWPTLDDLLHALASGSRRRRQRIAFGAVLGAAALAGGLEGHRRWEHAEGIAACVQEGSSIEEVWDDAVKSQVRGAFEASGSLYAMDAHARLLPVIDRFVATWTMTRAQVCRRALDRVWDEPTVERASACLDETRWSLEALIGIYAEADASVVQRANQAAASLPDAADCLDRSRLDHRPTAPSASEQRAEIRSVQRALERASSLGAAGRFAEGLQLARELVTRADALGWNPLAARARHVTGTLAGRAGEPRQAELLLEAAFLSALTDDDDLGACRAAIDLVHVVGVGLARHEDGLRWGRVARALLDRSADTELDATLDINVGLVHLERAHYADAQPLFERAIAIREQTHGADHPDVAMALLSLANVHFKRSDYAAAQPLYARALAIHERTLGMAHPDVATSVNNLASIDAARGDYAAAKPQYERALGIRMHALGLDHPDLAQALNNLAIAHKKLGELDVAERLHRHALAIHERTFGPEHPSVATSMNNLGDTLSLRGDHVGARAFLERALAVREAKLGPEHPEVASSLHNLASAAARRGDHAEAQALLRRAVTIYERVHGAEHPRLATLLRQLGEAALALKRADQAVSPLERALASLEQHRELREETAETRLQLARALWDSREDPGRARELARLAAAAFTAEGLHERAGEAESWLAEHTESGAGRARSRPPRSSL